MYKEQSERKSDELNRKNLQLVEKIGLLDQLKLQYQANNNKIYVLESKVRREMSVINDPNLFYLIAFGQTSDRRGTHYVKYDVGESLIQLLLCRHNYSYFVLHYFIFQHNIFSFFIQDDLIKIFIFIFGIDMILK